MTTRNGSGADPVGASRRLTLGLPARAGTLVADLAVVVAANLAAFVIRFDGAVPGEYVPYMVFGFPIVVGAYLAAFVILGTYRSIWRYASVIDLKRLITACAVGCSLHALGLALLGWRSYPRSVLVFTAVLGLCLMGGLRLLARSAVGQGTELPHRTRDRRVVIVGTGKAGESIAREMRDAPDLGYELVGFLGDDGPEPGATIQGAPVLGPVASLGAVAATQHLDEVIIAVPHASGREMCRIAGTCIAAGLGVKTLPSIGELVRGEGKLRYLRDLRDDELLRRAPISPDRAALATCLTGKRVMVTGAGGSIGSELCRQLAGFELGSLVMVERAESPLHQITLEVERRNPRIPLVAALADVKHVAHMQDIFARVRPQLVFHTAAYKHVPVLEGHPGEAVLNNVVGTRRLAEVALVSGVERFVFVSTDKAVRPESLMGATKKICEMYLVARNRALRATGAPSDPFSVVRFGNVLGSAGSVVPLFQRQIESGEPLTITHPEVSRYFMTIAEAVGLILQGVTLAGSGDVLVLDMGSPVKIDDLADDLVMSLGLDRAEVPKRYTGLRPGERLHEALWDGDVERVHRAAHDRILVVEQPPQDLAALTERIGVLEHLAVEGDVPGLLRVIRELVPTYSPPPGKAPFAVPEAGKTVIAGTNGSTSAARALQAYLMKPFDLTDLHPPVEAGAGRAGAGVAARDREVRAGRNGH